MRTFLYVSLFDFKQTIQKQAASVFPLSKMIIKI